MEGGKGLMRKNRYVLWERGIFERGYYHQPIMTGEEGLPWNGSIGMLGQETTPPPYPNHY